MIKANGHYTLSPSGAHRWMTCIGSAKMEEGLPDDPSEYADEGTAAHMLAKIAWDEGRDTAAYVGRRLDLGHKTWEVTEEMADEVRKYLNTLKALSVNGETFTEVEIPIAHITGEADSVSTSDAIIVDVANKELIGADLKYGMGIRVFAKDNPQLMLYLLGEYDVYSLVYDITQVRGIIHQPRLDHVDEWTWTIAELEEFREKVRDKAKMATEVLALTDKVEIERWLLPGKHQCQFCKAKGGNDMFPDMCPALSKKVEKDIGADFEALVEGGTKLVDELVPQTADGIGVKMDATDLMEIYIKAVRARVETLLLQGMKVMSPSGGYKLVEGRQGNRAWASADEAEKLLKSFRLKTEEMYDLKVISPTSAEKLLEKKHPKQWTKAQEIITRAPAGKSVAHMADKRPAVEVATTTSADFDAGDDLI